MDATHVVPIGVGVASEGDVCACGEVAVWRVGEWKRRQRVFGTQPVLETRFCGQCVPSQVHDAASFEEAERVRQRSSQLRYARLISAMEHRRERLREDGQLALMYARITTGGHLDPSELRYAWRALQS